MSNSRQRFLAVMAGETPDALPLFPEGIRAEVLRAWRKQGLPRRTSLERLFHYDDFEELDPDIYPKRAIRNWADHSQALLRLQKALDPDDSARLPSDWPRRVRAWKERQQALFVRIHSGLFLTLGVEAWSGFREAILLLVNEPAFVGEVLAVQASFAARLAEHILREVAVDAVIFNEPIAAPHGPLISPRMYRELVLPAYTPVFDVLERYRVPVVIWRSYANPGKLAHEAAAARFNALWVCETPPGGVDYYSLRQQFPHLGLIGGIDSDVLRGDGQAVRQAIEAVLPLARGGRYIPLADGRVREDVPYASYASYRRALEEIFYPG